jgi:hypothetical protein
MSYNSKQRNIKQLHGAMTAVIDSGDSWYAAFIFFYILRDTCVVSNVEGAVGCKGKQVTAEHLFNFAIAVKAPVAKPVMIAAAT